MNDDTKLGKMRNALEEILRMARTTSHGESEASKTWRKAIERIAVKALYPEEMFIK